MSREDEMTLLDDSPPMEEREAARRAADARGLSREEWGLEVERDPKTRELLELIQASRDP